MDMRLMKLAGGMLAPADEETAEVLQKVKTGQVLNAQVRRMRNYKNHRRFWAFLGLVFDIWADTVPKMQYKGQEVRPTMDRFRSDLVILAGYYEATVNIRGEVRLEAKSISFASMEEDEFHALFSACINVVLTKILTNGQLTEEQIRNHVDQVMQFDS